MLRHGVTSPALLQVMTSCLLVLISSGEAVELGVELLLLLLLLLLNHWQAASLTVAQHCIVECWWAGEL